MSATYRAAIPIGLPDAIVVVDHFHVVQLANKMLSMVRRRTTAETRGRRGRAGDSEWKARRCLLRNREDLTDEQFAKESLRDLLALAGTGADRHRAGHARGKFLTWCADSDIFEAVRLAVTVDRWWAEIAAFLDTGHSNAKSEDINRVIKLAARNAFGFRNPEARGRREAARRSPGCRPRVLAGGRGGEQFITGRGLRNGRRGSAATASRPPHSSDRHQKPHKVIDRNGYFRAGLNHFHGAQCSVVDRKIFTGRAHLRRNVRSSPP